MDISRSVLVPYPVDCMFDLIEQAERYPEFLPWCTGATILERSDEWVAARIDFSYRGFSFGFQTRNAKARPEWMRVRLVEGPFRRFHGDWHLAPIGDLGCRVRFDVSYEVANAVLDRLARPAVEIVSRTMMDAFVRRAERVLADSPLPPAPLPADADNPFAGPPATPDGIEPT